MNICATGESPLVWPWQSSAPVHPYPLQDSSSLAFFHLLPLILHRFSQLPQGTVLASWIKMADSAGEEEENELGASRKEQRGEWTKRKIKGERDFVAWTTEAKAGIIDESFRNLDFEAGSPLNGMNTGRSIVRRTFGGFGWEVLSSCPREQVFAVSIIPLCRIEKNLTTTAEEGAKYFHLF